MSEFHMSGRSDVERYRMRGTDYVESYSRTINGTEYEFSRVTWANGEVTVCAWRHNDSTPVHMWGQQV
jgi:hypothetical protein